MQHHAVLLAIARLSCLIYPIVTILHTTFSPVNRPRAIMRSVTEYRQAYRQADDMMMKIIKIAYFSTPLSFGAPLPM